MPRKHQVVITTMPEDEWKTCLRKLFHLFPRGRMEWVPDLDTWQYTAPPKLDPSSYGMQVSDYRADRLRVDFLAKAKFLKGNDPEAEALRGFLEAESLCKESNRRLKAIAAGEIPAPFFNAVMLTAQRKIAKALGRFRISELLTESRWGPGVTSSCKGYVVSAERKFGSKPEVTPNFSVKASQLLSLLPSWSALLADVEPGTWVSPLCKVIKGNRVAFVPKSAKTHRVIAIEPHINSYFQLGIGRMIRKRLRRQGIDLDKQTLNQRLAQHGSIHDDLATIDLQSASDTISRELVSQLLPEDWLRWLEVTRSQMGTLDGKVFFVYEKFSSMGNGATFDLESLIFWALSSSVTELLGYNTFWVNVMGDDIIIPTGVVSEFLDVMSIAGFVVNQTKSYTSGPFRESCGQDFFMGAAVRPVYLKDTPNSPLAWLKIANAIRRLAHRWNNYQGCDKRLAPAWQFAVSKIPKDWREPIPDGYGDGGLVLNFDEASPSLAHGFDKKFQGWEGYVFKHVAAKAVTYQTTGRELVTAGVYKLSLSGNEKALRGMVTYKKATSVAPVWRDLGPWR